MTPKQYINHIRWIEGRKKAICDGITEPLSIAPILYTLFIISGLVLFIKVLNNWELIKDKIKKGEK